MGGSFRWLAAVVLISLLVGGATAEIQCSDAASKLLPCQSFLLSGATAPSGACCTAVQSLETSATPADRKAICQCFKGLAKSLPINIAKAQQIPKFCHVNIGVAIDPNIDCNRLLP
ncbi:hypothetical protein ACS0TY_032034 [Phlomoides rotata]